MRACMCAVAHMWRPEDNLKKSIFSLYQVGPRIQTQGISLGSKHLYMLSHLGDPLFALVGNSWQLGG